MLVRRFRPRRNFAIISIVLLLGFTFIYWSIVRLAHYILENSRNSPENKQKPIRPRYGMNVIVGHYIGSGRLFGNLSREVLNENNFQPVPGEGDNGNPVIIPQKDLLIMHQKYRVNRFNIMASDRISLNRSLPDVRRKRCTKEIYPFDLPKTSVIIVFHNEAWSVLLRTVWSVINRSPSHLLEEIILVDDDSDREFLKSNLERYVAELPIKTRVFRQRPREGLVAARLLGAKVAKGSVLTFLDAHCECTIGWLEPLLARVAEDNHKVVCPVIDIISDDHFGYIKSFEMHWGAFNWQLLFRWYLLAPTQLKKRSSWNIQPFATPAMAGGLYSIDRSYFYQLGEYDEQMKIWGGDNLEMSFRIWQCGGQIEIVPCSHVGHLFRKTSPYTFPGGVNNILNENLARAALVWMDDWSKFFFKINNIPLSLSSNLNVTKRKQLRQQLSCANFEWYLTKVWPNNFFPHKNRFFGKIAMVGPGSLTYSNYLHFMAGIDLEFNYKWPYTISFLNKRTKEFETISSTDPEMFCLNKAQTDGGFKQVQLQRCHDGLNIDELVVITDDGQIMMNEGICLDSFKMDDDESEISVRLANCAGNKQQMWNYDITTQEIVQSNLCLTSALEQEAKFKMARCSGIQSQKWLLFPLNWT